MIAKNNFFFPFFLHVSPNSKSLKFTCIRWRVKLKLKNVWRCFSCNIDVEVDSCFCAKKGEKPTTDKRIKMKFFLLLNNGQKTTQKHKTHNKVVVNWWIESWPLEGAHLAVFFSYLNKIDSTRRLSDYFTVGKVLCFLYYFVLLDIPHFQTFSISLLKGDTTKHFIFLKGMMMNSFEFPNGLLSLIRRSH